MISLNISYVIVWIWINSKYLIFYNIQMILFPWFNIIYYSENGHLIQVSVPDNKRAFNTTQKNLRIYIFILIIRRDF